MPSRTILYVHGYGSDSNAMKGQLLRRMFPECHVVSPTLDYQRLMPSEAQQLIADTVRTEHVGMIVGCSFGGYHAICASRFFKGPIWAINPVHDLHTAMERVMRNSVKLNGRTVDAMAERVTEAYARFDDEVFKPLTMPDASPTTQLHFALSTDDELLGDHQPLLELFPNHGTVVWKDRSGHTFNRFYELRDELAATMI